MTLRIAVCIATYRRPSSLDRLLRALAAIEPGSGGWRLMRVVVSDSDPDRTARGVVDGAAPGFPGSLQYVEAPGRGISAARNAAVAAALDADAIAFIDDDERPAEGWLDELTACRRRTGADIVVGPVLPEFDVEPPDWVVRGGFFEPLRFDPDSPLSFANAGNCLMSAPVAARYGFDPRFGASGGEDTQAFMRARLDGVSIVWCSSGPVVEAIPPERTSARWLVAREFRRGNTLSLCLLDLELSLPRVLKRTAHGGLRIALGSARFLLLGAAGKHERVRALREMAFGAGLLVGLVGWRYQPYASS